MVNPFKWYANCYYIHVYYNELGQKLTLTILQLNQWTRYNIWNMAFFHFSRCFATNLVNFGAHGPPLNQLRLTRNLAGDHNLPKGNFLESETRLYHNSFFWDTLVYIDTNILAYIYMHIYLCIKNNIYLFINLIKMKMIYGLKQI